MGCSLKNRESKGKRANWARAMEWRQGAEEFE